ncbi:MAG: BrnA antitoxin family protein [Desulfovibrionaceae bacterium]|nr:BrnA antitoxin family protein [Desulfovibrionaceae bacterium]
MTGGKYQPAINTILRGYTEYPVDRLAEALNEDLHPLEHSKKPTSIRLDEDVLSWFKNGGEGYQTRINEVLRTFMTYSKAASAG